MISAPVMTDFTCCYIIPARGGSKRIIDKNIQKIAGKPLVQWPIKEAWEMDIHPYVSTDSDKIAEQCNGAAILNRPADLCEDESRWSFLDYHYNRGELQYDLIGMRQCTTPFFGVENAEQCFRLAALTGKCVSVVAGGMDRVGMRKTGGLYVIPSKMISSGEYKVQMNWLYVVVDEFSAIDIDTPEDLEKARKAWTGHM